MANPISIVTFLDQSTQNPLPSGLSVTVYNYGASQIPANVIATGTTDVNGAASLALAFNQQYTAVFTGTGAPTYTYSFTLGNGQYVVGPFVDTVNAQTIGGAKTFSGAAQFSASVSVNSGSPGANGDLAVARSASSGLIAFGSGVYPQGYLEYGVNHAGAWSLTNGSQAIYTNGLYAGSSFYGPTSAIVNGPLSVSNTSCTITSGAGAPTSTTTPAGSIYLRTDGAAGTRVYVSQGATWAAIAGV